ncbi:MAG: divergent PAP2 family protein [Candidatus Omnitrophica bacterium]|nr:divergent PAP2 family protein [Candidatus Omnitrophota bacterium]
MGLAESGSFFAEFSRNKVFIPSLFAWVVAQIFKVLTGIAREKRFNFKWFLRSGGMPSSHTALSMCLTTSTGLYYGFDSGLFALALGFASITMFDAQGVRRHSGKQAEALNRLLEDIYSHRGFQESQLKELLGHTPVEVFAGCALGIVVALIFYKG